MSTETKIGKLATEIRERSLNLSVVAGRAVDCDMEIALDALADLVGLSDRKLDTLTARHVEGLAHELDKLAQRARTAARRVRGEAVAWKLS